MEYVVVAYRSRAHTVKFHEFLTNNGIHSEIVNTPKEAGVGCGLSVKISLDKLPFVKKAVNILALSSFAGVFSIKNFGGRTLIRSI